MLIIVLFFPACVQENFSASGCLDTLTLALVRLAPAADTSLLSCQLSVTISKTLSACITDNCMHHCHTHIHAPLTVHLINQSVSFSFHDLFFVAPLASSLARCGVVYHLFSLLASPHLHPEDRLSVLLTLGHCTEASGKTAQQCAVWVFSGSARECYQLYLLNTLSSLTHCYSVTVFMISIYFVFSCL